MDLNYRVYDNSFIININTGASALLVQDHDDCLLYRPDAQEDGSTFTICSNPYEEYVDKWGWYKFINVKSSKTGYIYRVLFNESAIL